MRLIVREVVYHGAAAGREMEGSGKGHEGGASKRRNQEATQADDGALVAREWLCVKKRKGVWLISMCVYACVCVYLCVAVCGCVGLGLCLCLGVTVQERWTEFVDE